MTESPSEKPEKPLFVLRLGDLHKPLQPGRSYTIGRSPECDVRLGHGSVGDVHCRVQVRDHEVTVHDLDSLAGIKVEGQRVLAQTWAPGQILEVGEIRVELEQAAHVWTLDQVAEAAAKLGTAHQVHDREFGALVSAELKRAPWFAISLVVHGIVLVLAWLIFDQQIPKGSGGARFSLELAEAEDSVEEDVDEAEVAEAEAMEDPEFQEAELMEEVAESALEEFDGPELDPGTTDMNDLLRKVGSSGTGISDILKEGKAALSGKFKKTVGRLRKDGLEIVFVFDSTGSMGAVLLAAKERITKMASVLMELVPYARIGVITYRDKDDGEEYLTREVALSRDFYRAINFLQGVYAGGGGDTPEAVYEALREATTQKWTSSARRLVILIGDAEPHKRTEGRISSMVKSFSRNGRSFVHAIVTRPSSEVEVSPKASRTFGRIARDGRGESLSFEDEAKILQAVMSLAFGRAENRSLDEVYRLAELRSNRYSNPAKGLALGKNIKALRREFKRSVISHDVVKAILHNPTRAVLEEIVDVASKSSYPTQARHAAAFILRKTLFLDEPPVDPETCKPLSRKRAERFKRQIRQKFK